MVPATAEERVRNLVLAQALKLAKERARLMAQVWAHVLAPAWVLM